MLAMLAPYRTSHLEGLAVRAHSDGARSQIDTGQKYANDAAVLEAALRDEPGNARYVFYLAQSYRDSGQWQKSLDTYQRRAAMDGWMDGWMDGKKKPGTGSMNRPASAKR